MSAANAGFVQCRGCLIVVALPIARVILACCGAARALCAEFEAH